MSQQGNKTKQRQKWKITKIKQEETVTKLRMQKWKTEDTLMKGQTIQNSKAKLIYKRNKFKIEESWTLKGENPSQK